MIQQRTISPMTNLSNPPVRRVMDFVITTFEVADLRLHCFEDRLSLLNFQNLDDAIEIVFVSAEINFCPHTRIREYSPESLAGWEHVKQGHVTCSTDIL